MNQPVYIGTNDMAPLQSQIAAMAPSARRLDILERYVNGSFIAMYLNKQYMNIIYAHPRRGFTHSFYYQNTSAGT